MSRFKLLEKEINKNIQVDEKANQTIVGWSPNNVRRLVIGFEFAIVQYFMTGGKYNRRMEVVDLRKGIDEDCKAVMNERDKYIPILDVLTRGRVCSSIEEIVISSDGYPNHILPIDADRGNILKNSAYDIASRFPRLQHVTITNLSVQEVGELLNASKRGTDLLYPLLVKRNAIVKNRYYKYSGTWYTGTALRPKYYAMDEKLKDYFDKVETAMLLKEKEQRLAESKWLTIKDLFSTTDKVVRKVFSDFSSVNRHADDVFNTATIIARLEWAKYLSKDNVMKAVGQQLASSTGVVNALKVVDLSIFDVYEKELTEARLSMDAFHRFVVLMDELADVFVSAEEKEKLPKQTESQTLETLQYLASELALVQYNVVFYSLVKYLSANSVQYVDYHLKSLNVDMIGLPYAKKTLDFCYSRVDKNTVLTVMDKIRAVRTLKNGLGVSASEFRILEALRGVNVHA